MHLSSISSLEPIGGSILDVFQVVLAVLSASVNS